MQKFALQNRFALLPRAYRLERYVWAKDMLQKSYLFWKNVLFSDETMIELFPKRKNFARLPKQSGSRQKYVAQHAKIGGKKMFWGFIKHDGNVSSRRYI